MRGKNISGWLRDLGAFEKFASHFVKHYCPVGIIWKVNQEKYVCSRIAGFLYPRKVSIVSLSCGQREMLYYRFNLKNDNLIWTDEEKSDGEGDLGATSDIVMDSYIQHIICSPLILGKVIK